MSYTGWVQFQLEVILGGKEEWLAVQSLEETSF